VELHCHARHAFRVRAFARRRCGCPSSSKFFIGPNFTYKLGNLTLKGSLWYYYMGYPTRGRQQLQAPTNYTTLDCTKLSATASNCLSTYSFSHNLEIIPAG